MTLTLNTAIVSKEWKKSTKSDKEYGVICFMDGTIPIQAMVADSVDFENIKIMDTADLELEIKLGKYTKLTVLDVIQ